MSTIANPAQGERSRSTSDDRSSGSRLVATTMRRATDPRRTDGHGCWTRWHKLGRLLPGRAPTLVELRLAAGTAVVTSLPVSLQTINNPYAMSSSDSSETEDLTIALGAGEIALARSRSRWRTLLRDLSDAIRGTEMAYTRGPISRAIFLLAIPMMLEMAMESVFAVVDVYFVSSLGPSAVATVGLTESVLTLVYAVAIGLAMGTTALVARRIGEKAPREAADAAVQAIFVGLAASIPFMLAGILFAGDILALMGADEWSLKHGYRFTAWMLGGNAVIMLIFIINSIFRGAGDAAIAMRVLWIANGINIVLDPVLIYGWGPFPEMGIEGAAVATNIGRGTGVLIQLFVLFRGAKHIRVAFSQVHLHSAVMWRLIRTSLGGIGQFIIATS